MASGKVRVFVADDSAVVRLAWSRLIEAFPELILIGEAADGKEALRKIPTLRPDVVLMDVMMPRMDGVTAIRELMSTHPTPVLVVSDLVEQEASLSFRAIEAGAIDVMRKPSRAELQDPAQSRQLARRIQSAASVPLVRKRRPQAQQRETPAPLPTQASERVLIGASTGGPQAIKEVLEGIGLPPWPVIVVQHIAPGFEAGMAAWLTEATSIPVHVARRGVLPEPGSVYLADARQHLVFRGDRLTYVDTIEQASVHRPCIDAFFESAVKAGLGPTSAAVVLTGMGRDGAAGLLSLRLAGARTLVQDPASALIDGMPGSAIAAGAAAEVVPLSLLGGHLRGATG